MGCFQHMNSIALVMNVSAGWANDLHDPFAHLCMLQSLIKKTCC